MSPSAPRKVCKKPNCGQLTHGQYCDKHEKLKKIQTVEVRRNYDAVRGSATSRGYNYRWSQYSKSYREANPLCVKCLEKGILKVNNCVDHIIPVTGPDDPLFWEPSNHQGLCTACHSEKTAKEDGGFGNIKRELE